MKPARRFCPECQRRFVAGLEKCPNDGAILRIDPFVGSRVGQWVLTDYLGQGAMGVVYTATPTPQATPMPGAPTEAAVKILNARRAALQPDLVRRFEIEARAAIRLESPHVARVFDSGTTDDGHLYIAMERLHGGPLDRILARASRLDGATVATIGYQIAQAMAEAHDKGIVHRDLKPGNVFVEPLPDGVWHVRVLDFGVARMRIGGMDRTRTGIVAGTPSYMSPEQLRGFRDLDGRSDIYSLGVLLYRTLAGRNPFQGDGSFAQAHQLHLQHTPPPLPDHVPAPLAALVMRLLAKAREQRPQTMYEVQAQLLTTGLIDLRAGSTAFQLDAETVAGVLVPPDPSDVTTPDSDETALQGPADRTEVSVPSGTRVDAGVRTGDDRTEIVPGDSEIVCVIPSRVAARAAEDPLDIGAQPTVPQGGRFTDTLDLPPMRRSRDLRAMAMILLVAGAAIGTGLGIGLQYGLSQPAANAASRPAGSGPPATTITSTTATAAADAPETTTEPEPPAEPATRARAEAPAERTAAARAEAPAERTATRATTPAEPRPTAHVEASARPAPARTAVPAEATPAARAEALPEPPPAVRVAASAAPTPAARVEAPVEATSAARAEAPAEPPPARERKPGPAVARRTPAPARAEAPVAAADPGTFDGRLNAALSAADSGLEGRAVELLQAAGEQRPESPIPHQRLCTLYSRLGLDEQALDSCLKWRTREPKEAYRASIDRRIETLMARLGR